MKTHTTLIAAMLATLIAGNALANTHAIDASETMTVDAEAPVRATLLPVVSTDATSATSESNPATMRVASTAPIEVTLLPTVHVTARARQDLAVTLLPTVRVTPASAALVGADEVAEAEDVAAESPVSDDASPTMSKQALGLRARTMPQ